MEANHSAVAVYHSQYHSRVLQETFLLLRQSKPLYYLIRYGLLVMRNPIAHKDLCMRTKHTHRSGEAVGEVVLSEIVR